MNHNKVAFGAFDPQAEVDIEQAEFDELGCLAIYRKGERKPAISIATDQLKFHPGCLLFRNLLKTCGRRSTEGSAVQ